MRAVSLSSPEVIEAIRTRTIPVHADGWVRSARVEARPRAELTLIRGQAVLEYPRRVRQEWRSTIRVDFAVEGYVESRDGRVVDLCLVADGRATNEAGRSVPFEAVARLGHRQPGSAPRTWISQ